VEKILLQLWKYFDNSAKRAAACICQSCYKPEEGPSQNKKGKEKAQKKVQESLQNLMAFD
jgi:hypothetical protein